jgi:hypothetical protein
MPFGPTTTFEPDRTKSVVSPVIDSVTGLPSPPDVDTVDTTVPAATVQASVGFRGENDMVRGADAGWTVIDNVALTLAAATGGLMKANAAITANALEICFMLNLEY